MSLPATSTDGAYCFNKVQFDEWGVTTSAATCDTGLDSIPEVRRSQGLNAVVQNGRYTLVRFDAAAGVPYYDYPPAIAVNPKTLLVYIVFNGAGSGMRVTTYDQDTFEVLSSFDLLAYGYSSTVALNLWGEDGLALSTGGELYLWRDQ